MNRSISRGFAWFLCLFFALALVVTWSYNTRARLMPLVILIPALLLTLAWLWLDSRGGGEKADQEDNPELFKEMWVMGWFLLLLVIMWLLGFLVAIPVFLVVFLRRWAEESWPLTLSVAGAFTVALYLAFEVGFHLILYRGWLFSFR